MIRQSGRLQRWGWAFSGGLFLSILATCPAQGASPPGEAHDGAAPPEASEPLASDELPFLDVCVTEADRETKRKAQGNEAFRSATVPLGPFYWATADRELVQAMLMYWRILDVEDNTKLTLFLPLYVDHCSPEANTWIGPFGLWGGQTDVEGTAGWGGPYFYRRDKKLKYDVLLPIFYWSRLQDGPDETLILGPYFDLTRESWSLNGFAPVFASYTDAEDRFLQLAPAFARWGQGKTSNTLLLQTWHRDAGDVRTTLSLPFWFAHDDDVAKRTYRAAPGYFSWTSDEHKTMLAGPYISRRSPYGGEHGLLPFYMHGSVENDAQHESILSLIADTPDEKFGYTVIPPLLFAGWGQGDSYGFILAQTRYTQKPGMLDVFSPPFFFHHESDKLDENNFTIVPPLLSGYVHDKAEDGFELQAYGPWFSYRRNDGLGEHEAIGPVWLSSKVRTKNDRGELEESYVQAAPPVGFVTFGDENKDTTIVGPAFWSQATNVDARGNSIGQKSALGVLPFYAGGRGLDAEGNEESAWDLIPPLLTWRNKQADQSTLVVGPYYDVDLDTGRETGVLGLYHQAEISEPKRHLGAMPLRSLGILPKRYWVAPPLLSMGFEDAHSSFKFIAGYYRWRTAHRDLYQGFAPFYFSSTSAAGRWYDVAPLALTGAWGDAQEKTIYSINTYFHENRANDAWQLASIPFFSVGDDGEGGDHLVIPPLALATWGDAESRSMWVGQTWYDRWDLDTHPDAPSFELVSFPFVAAGRRAETGKHWAYAPLAAYASWGDTAEQHNLVAGPWLSFHDEELEELDWMLLPVAAGGTAKGGSYLIGPGFARWGSGKGFNEGDRENLLAGQTWWSRDKEAWSLLSVPFYAGFEDPDEDSFGHFIPPLATALWHTPESDYKLITGYVELEDADGADQGFFPFYISGNEKPGRKGTPATKLAKAAFSPELSDVLTDWSDGLEERSYRLAPGYMHLEGLDAADGKRWALSLAGQTYFYGNDVDGPGLFGSVPFYFGLRTLDPAVYGDLIPLLAFARWQNGAKDASPEDRMFFNDYQRGLVAGPYFDVTMEETTYRGLPPLFLWMGDEDSSALLTPLGASWGDAVSRQLWLAQTWARWSTDDENPSFTIASIPFYFGDRSSAFSDGSGFWSGYDIVPPLLFAHWWDRDEDNTWVGPYLSMTTSTELLDGTVRDDNLTLLFPLLLSITEGTESGAVFTPGFYKSWDKDRMELAVLQTFLETSPESWDIASHPFYYGSLSHKTGAYEHNVPLALTFIWGQTVVEGSPAHEAGLRSTHSQVIGPYVHLEHQDGFDRGFVPFYLHGEGTPSRSTIGRWMEKASTTVLGDLAARPFRSAAGYRYSLFPGAFSVEDQEGLEHTTLIGQTLIHRGQTEDGRKTFQTFSAPFYWGHDDEQSRSHVIPPALTWWGSDDVAGQEHAVSVPLGLFYEKDRSGSTKVVGPYFDYERGGKRFKGLLPFYVDAREDEKFLSMYSPAIWSWGDDDTSRTLGPLVWKYVSKSEQAADTIVFPIYWDIERPQFDATMVAGVYWRFGWEGDNGDKSLTVTPGWARYEDAEEVLNVAALVAWSKGKGTHQDAWALHFGPALSLYSYHQEHFRWKAGMGLLGYERERDIEQWTVGFVKLPQTARAETPAEPKAN